MANAEGESIRTASEEISRRFKTLIDSRDLDSLKQSQHLILGRLQDSNAVLSHFNEYSENCFADVSADFSRNTRLLRSMKSDLDYIFQKLRCVVIPDFFIFNGFQNGHFLVLRNKDGFLLGHEISTSLLDASSFGVANGLEYMEGNLQFDQRACLFLKWGEIVVWSLKTKLLAAYPDAFPDDTAMDALDQRPDLELPR